MTGGPRGSVAIAGIGLAGIGEAPGRDYLDLTAEAARLALTDAGLEVDDVDGLFTSNILSLYAAIDTAEHLGLAPRYLDGTNIGGASFLRFALTAAAALDARLCDVALICYGSNQRTAGGRLATRAEVPWYEAPYADRYPMYAYALAASRHMHEWGTTRTHLAHFAHSARRWAQKNPLAFARDPLTLDEILAARPVCDPLSRRDCCLVTDGAGAVVMVRADRARDLPTRPVYYLGGGSEVRNRTVTCMDSLTETSARQSGAHAFAQARLTPSDVDVLQLYDAFTINVLLLLEDLGFAAKGDAGPMAAEGRFAPGGDLPINTNGGGLSFCHPGMYGIFTLIEAVEQLRDTAGERQVDGANIALCHGVGAQFSGNATVILGTETTV